MKPFLIFLSAALAPVMNFAQSAKILAEKAVVANNNKKFVQALSYINQALTIDTMDADLYYKKGVFYFQ
jgi:Flp pilus assembly protein TadD